MDFLWEEEWWTQQRCKKHHSPSLSQGKNYPLSFHQMRTGEDANIFRLPTIQSLQVFGKSSRKESGREKAKQEHKRAKVFHATPQPASPLAARLGSREGRHCPPLSLDHGAGFSYVLFPWWPGNICFLFKSDGGGSGGTCITSHCTLGGESLASPWRSLSHTGEKKKNPNQTKKPNQNQPTKPKQKSQKKKTSYRRHQGPHQAPRSLVWPQGWPCCEQDVGPETSWGPLLPELPCDPTKKIRGKAFS